MTPSLFCLLTFALTASLAQAAPATAEPTVLHPNGGWCWFQGERALVVSNRLFFTTIAGDTRGGWEAGDLVATQHDFQTGKTTHFELHDRFHRDDHDVAGLAARPDGRILAVYGKHGNDRLQRWRITTRPADGAEWSPEQTLDVGVGYTYSNVYRLEAEGGRTYNFHRGLGFNPNCTISDDGGETWRYGWRLLEWTRADLQGDPRFTGLDGTRPYLRYAGNGTDAIHFIVTEDHPRAYDNSLYHGFYRGGALRGSDGREVGKPGMDGTSTLKPRSFTEVFRGGPDRVAWATDLRLDDRGNPYAAFSVQVDGAASRAVRGGGAGGQDHRYYFARWDGTAWQVHPLAHAGSKLYPGEDDYTGLVALDPQDPNGVVISTNADPVTGAPLVSATDQRRHWEIFSGRTADGGRTWTWQRLTRDSTQDNLRPVIPSRPGGPRTVLWGRGDLRSYTDYRLEIVMRVLER